VEIPSHPWFVAVQFHPEFKSQPTRPQPLFAGFIAAAVQRHRARTERAPLTEPSPSDGHRDGARGPVSPPPSATAEQEQRTS
jgi:hypothetical protein